MKTKNKRVPASVLWGTAIALTLPLTLPLAGCQQASAASGETTGDMYASNDKNADMKKVILNVFGMT